MSIVITDYGCRKHVRKESRIEIRRSSPRGGRHHAIRVICSVLWMHRCRRRARLAIVRTIRRHWAMRNIRIGRIRGICGIWPALRGVSRCHSSSGIPFETSVDLRQVRSVRECGGGVVMSVWSFCILTGWFGSGWSSGRSRTGRVRRRGVICPSGHMRNRVGVCRRSCGWSRDESGRI